jgi:AcrR family transcriptional regulator
MLTASRRLSMRRVAESLDVGTMSLDRYVPGKAELLDLMLDRVRAPTRPSPASATTGAPRWRRWVRGMWRLYLRHPWLPFVDQSRPLLGPNSLDGFEFALHGLDDAGLTSQQKVNAISLIGAFVSSAARMHNNAVTAEQRTGLSTEEFWQAQTPVIERAMSTGRYPLIATLDEHAFASTAEEFFEFGLRCLLDGLEALVDRRQDGAAPDR